VGFTGFDGGQLSTRASGLVGVRPVLDLGGLEM
jgi:hypothetical protein